MQSSDDSVTRDSDTPIPDGTPSTAAGATSRTAHGSTPTLTTSDPRLAVNVAAASPTPVHSVDREQSGPVNPALHLHTYAPADTHRPRCVPCRSLQSFGQNVCCVRYVATSCSADRSDPPHSASATGCSAFIGSASCSDPSAPGAPARSSNRSTRRTRIAPIDSGHCARNSTAAVHTFFAASYRHPCSWHSSRSVNWSHSSGDSADSGRYTRTSSCGSSLYTLTVSISAGMGAGRPSYTDSGTASPVARSPLTSIAHTHVSACRIAWTPSPTDIAISTGCSMTPPVAAPSRIDRQLRALKSASAPSSSDGSVRAATRRATTGSSHGGGPSVRNASGHAPVAPSRLITHTR